MCARKRARRAADDSEDSSASDSGDGRSASNNSTGTDTDGPAKRQRSSTEAAYPAFVPGKDDLAYKMAVATARVMVGLSSRDQVLNKTMVAKILDAENNKGSGLQFKKSVLPALSMLVSDVFHYEVVELPSKKAATAAPGAPANGASGPGGPNGTQHEQRPVQPHKSAPSYEFILVNRLPPSLRALNYTFMAEHTQPIGKSLRAMDRSKHAGSTGGAAAAAATSIYGEDLPRPTSGLVQSGITLLVLCLVLLHGNNILQSDLVLLLRTKFGLKFKEKETVSILGDQTLTDFLAMLGRHDYLDRTLITATGAAGTGTGTAASSQRAVNSRSTRHDDNTLILRLGRRCRVEWSVDEFVGLFRQLMQDEWTEQLQESAVYTVKSVWKQ